MCNTDGAVLVYEGPIRGSVNKKSVIAACDNCKAWFAADQEAVDYASGAYRSSVGNDDFELHLPGILRVMDLVGENYHSLIDVGASCGNFVKIVQSHFPDKRVVAVEPNREQAHQLRGIVKEVYSDTSEIGRKDADVVTSFHVVEHVVDPVAFMRDLASLAANDGHIIISTPNRYNYLMYMIQKEYRPFFFRAWHNFYFCAESLIKLAEISGLQVAGLFTCHSRGIGSAFGWLRDKRPTGKGVILHESQAFALDDAWAAYLDSLMLGDTLYMICKKRTLQ